MKRAGCTKVNCAAVISGLLGSRHSGIFTRRSLLHSRLNMGCRHVGRDRSELAGTGFEAPRRDSKGFGSASLGSSLRNPASSDDSHPLRTDGRCRPALPPRDPTRARSLSHATRERGGLERFFLASWRPRRLVLCFVAWSAHGSCLCFGGSSGRRCRKVDTLQPCRLLGREAEALPTKARAQQVSSASIFSQLSYAVVCWCWSAAEPAFGPSIEAV